MANFANWKKWAKVVAGCFLLLSGSPRATAQEAVKPQEIVPHHVDTAPCATGLWSAPHYSLGEVIGQSICGKEDPARPWTPLPLSTLFSEGWLEPWIAPPNGSSGAPRQGWLNSFDGHFVREWHLGYFYTNHLANDDNAHLGLFQFFTPLSRRLLIGIDVPFLVGLEGHGPGESQVDFGDIIIAPRVMLHETQDLSVSAGLGIRTPTGRRETVGDITSVFPNIQAWADLGRSVTLRGGFGVDVPFEAAPVPDATLLTNIAIGQTITPHDATPFGDFAYYLAINMRNEFSSAEDHTFFTLAPGVRMHLGNNYFLLMNYEFQVTGPQLFDQRFGILIVKGF
jgi:hypothetical protein